jgi:hypothetical protein
MRASHGNYGFDAAAHCKNSKGTMASPEQFCVWHITVDLQSDTTNSSIGGAPV